LAERVPDKINLMIVYGSGGHTTEMSWIFKDYDFKTRCNRVFFLKAQSDHVTMAKVKQFIEEHKVLTSLYSRSAYHKLKFSGLIFREVAR
jgi:hypothetical protein